MAKNIVFVLHGIGQYTDGWMSLESCAVPPLKAAAKRYPFFEGKSLDTFVEFVPILYDDVFEKIQKHWADLAKDLKAAIPVLPRFADKLFTYMEKGTEDTFALNNGADVALYWGFRLFQQRVVLRVLAQIASKIAATIAATDQVPHYHILAHSMGTAVAHDALHHLGTEAWLTALKTAPLDDADGERAKVDRAQYLGELDRVKDATSKQSPFDPANFAFQSITMLSNVSGLIHGAESPYHSIVRPGTPGDNGAFVSNYVNVNHKFDPISIIGNFKMPGGWAIGGGGVDVVLEHLAGDPEQLHDAAHYVRHPAVHLRLLAQYVDPYAPSADDVKQVAKFAKEHSVQAAVKAKLEKLSDSPQWKNFIGRLRELRDVVEGVA